jgi:hypothetical protein
MDYQFLVRHSDMTQVLPAYSRSKRLKEHVTRKRRLPDHVILTYGKDKDFLSSHKYLIWDTQSVQRKYMASRNIDWLITEIFLMKENGIWEPRNLVALRAS